ncbi:MAG: hypothetical protein WCG47_16195 [Dermatophilaceae bacterium]
MSRNLWHSCGQFTLEDLFARSTPETLELARAYIPHLADLDEELRGWLQESYDTVGVQADLPPRRAR